MKNFQEEPFLQYIDDGRVFLNLPAVKKNSRRLLGKIDRVQNTFYSVKRYRNAHLYRKLNSLSIPYDMIYRAEIGFKYVCINFENSEYWTSVFALLLRGVKVNFFHLGFEAQIHLELSLWKKSKREARYERAKIRNGELV
jgi:hypothetical protein